MNMVIFDQKNIDQILFGTKQINDHGSTQITMYHNSYNKPQLKNYTAKYGLYRGTSRAFQGLI